MLKKIVFLMESPQVEWLSTSIVSPLFLFACPAQAKRKYFRAGSDADSPAEPLTGLAWGGGPKQDAAFNSCANLQTAGFF